MTRFFLAALAAGLAPLPASATDPSYAKDVQPFVQKYCLECHNGQKAKAGVNLESLDKMLAPTKKGAAVVPEKPEKSLLVLTLTGGAKQMPPKKFPQKPTKDEVATVKAWVAAGAKDDTPAKKAKP